MTDFNSSINKIIGHRIKQYRAKNNLNQEELASLTGLVRASISNIESGRHQIPLSTLYKVANVLKADVRDILPGTKEVENYIEKHSIEAQLNKYLDKHSLASVQAIFYKNNLG